MGGGHSRSVSTSPVDWNNIQINQHSNSKWTNNQINNNNQNNQKKPDKYYYLNRGFDTLWNESYEKERRMNCIYSDWTPWTPCDAVCRTNCGTQRHDAQGQQKRQRYIISDAINGGRSCNTNALNETRSCNKSCPNTENCYYSYSSSFKNNNAPGPRPH